MPVPFSPATIIHSLICKLDRPMGLTCLDFMMACSAGAKQFAFYEDGSLEQDDVAMFGERYPLNQIVTRTESDELVRGQSEKYSGCRKYRAKDVFGLKLLETPTLNQELIWDFDVKAQRLRYANKPSEIRTLQGSYLTLHNH